MTIPTANVGYAATPSSKKLHDPKRLRQRPTTENENIDVSSTSFQFLVVVRCRNHLATLLSSSSSSKIPNLSLEFRCCQFCHSFRDKYFRFRSPSLIVSQISPCSSVHAPLTFFSLIQAKDPITLKTIRYAQGHGRTGRESIC